MHGLFSLTAYTIRPAKKFAPEFYALIAWTQFTQAKMEFRIAKVGLLISHPCPLPTLTSVLSIAEVVPLMSLSKLLVKCQRTKTCSTIRSWARC
jgi:hypothetical protein